MSVEFNILTLLEVLLHLVIIGSGVIGLTSAYYLSSLGYKVTVIEKNNSSAMEASIANGSLLSYTSGPLASPSVLKMLPQNTARTSSINPSS